MPIKRFPSDVTAGQIRSLSPAPPAAEVTSILEAVRTGGDAAVLDFEHRFGGAPEPAPDARIDPVDPAWLAKQPDQIDAGLRAALELAIANVSAVAQAQLTAGVAVVLPQGQRIEYRDHAVASAGAYIPGGRGSYPSTAVMCLATARVAGVQNLCAVSPPREHGQVDSAVAAVCALLGVETLYPVGGAQAVAALAFGTASISPVDVIVGPGNSWVQEAKRQLVGRIGIDGVAGPSELVVVADGTADPAAVAFDLMAQGEHGPDSLVALISPDPDLLDAVIGRCGSIDAEMAVVLAHDLDAAIELADVIAPEHLQVMADDQQAERLAAKVTRAGALFIGHNAATAFGDYVAGSNHVLPTGGAARYSDALSVATFRRRMACVQVPDSAVGELSRAGAAIARAEGFSNHAQSMEARDK